MVMNFLIFQVQALAILVTIIAEVVIGEGGLGCLEIHSILGRHLLKCQSDDISCVKTIFLFNRQRIDESEFLKEASLSLDGISQALGGGQLSLISQTFTDVRNDICGVIYHHWLGGAGLNLVYVFNSNKGCQS